MRLPTFNKPRVIACGEELADHIALPRGCLAEVIELLKSHRINPIVRDERFVGRPIEVEFSGRLRPLQQDAVDAFAQHDERMYARRLKGYGLIGYTIRDASNETSFLQQLEHQSPKEPSITGEI